MPSFSQDYDPIVRWQIVDGMISYFNQSGEAIFSVELQEEESDRSAIPSHIDSVIKANKLPLVERVDRNALAMKKQGLSFKKMGDRHVLFDVEADARDKSLGTAGYKQLVDLATGQIIREAVLQEDGRYASFSVMQYKLVQDYPVLANEQNYTFGTLSNGEWGVKNITITNRGNQFWANQYLFEDPVKTTQK